MTKILGYISTASLATLRSGEACSAAVVQKPEGDWKHPIMDVKAVAEAQVSALTQALRTMRKHGFIVVQDKPGRTQTPADQLHRAQSVAADMLGVPIDYEDANQCNLAMEIVKVADAAQGLPQFR